MARSIGALGADSAAGAPDSQRLASLFDLTGRHVLVTGAASGLGKAISAGVLAFGARLSAVDRHAESLHEMADQLAPHGGMFEAISCDVTRTDDVEAAIDAAEASGGAVTGLVNSAGTGRRSLAVEMGDESWQEVIDINLGGTFRMCRAVGRRLIAASTAGSIVNISSIAGQVGLRTGNANYSASKGGVDALTRTLAIEWATNGVRVNAIAPTHFATPLVEQAIAEEPSRLDYFLGNIPLGRLGHPSDIVGSAVFLLSEASAMVTGHILNVDGGHSIA